MKKYLYPAKMVCAGLGLVVLLLVIASGAAYPSPVFRIGAPLGLGLIALALVLMVADWVWDMHNAIRQRRPLELLGLLISAVAVVWIFLIRQ